MEGGCILIVKILEPPLPLPPKEAQQNNFSGTCEQQTLGGGGGGGGGESLPRS